jgi:hypothetical protein
METAKEGGSGRRRTDGGGGSRRAGRRGGAHAGRGLRWQAVRPVAEAGALVEAVVEGGDGRRWPKGAVTGSGGEGAPEEEEEGCVTRPIKPL